MGDVFLCEDISHVLNNKFIVIIGDSVQRAIYKDLVLLLQKNIYLSDTQLRAKGEFSFSNDELIEGGKRGQMTNGINYREVRQYQTDFHLVRFYFVTRCYNNYVESILTDLGSDPKPDVVIMNSCLWDISRYGRSGVENYKINIEKVFTRFKEVLQPECLFLWNTTLPISKTAKGGFLVPQVEFMNSTLRLDILEANFYAHQMAAKYDYDVLDLHYYLRNQLHRRAEDGIHWDMTAHRRITNLILTHIAEAWGELMPGRATFSQGVSQVGPVPNSHRNDKGPNLELPCFKSFCEPTFQNDGSPQDYLLNAREATSDDASDGNENAFKKDDIWNQPDSRDNNEFQIFSNNRTNSPINFCRGSNNSPSNFGPGSSTNACFKGRGYSPNINGNSPSNFSDDICLPSDGARFDNLHNKPGRSDMFVPKPRVPSPRIGFPVGPADSAETNRHTMNVGAARNIRGPSPLLEMAQPRPFQINPMRGPGQLIPNEAGDFQWQPYAQGNSSRVKRLHGKQNRQLMREIPYDAMNRQPARRSNY